MDSDKSSSVGNIESKPTKRHYTLHGKKHNLTTEDDKKHKTGAKLDFDDNESISSNSTNLRLVFGT